MGYTTYTVARSGPPPLTTCAAWPTNCTEGEGAIFITNGVLELLFSKATGQLVRVRDPALDLNVEVGASLRFYTHRLDTPILPWFLRPSGHYIFHPDGEAHEARRGGWVGVGHRGA